MTNGNSGFEDLMMFLTIIFYCAVITFALSLLCLIGASVLEIDV